MPKATLADILSEYQNNMAFREAWKESHTQAIIKFGFELSLEDQTKVEALLQKSEELDKRTNK